MADLKTTISLDDKKFAEGARRVEGRSRQLGRTVDRSFSAPTADELVRKFATVDVAFQTVKRGIDQAGRAVEEYEAKWPELTASMGRSETAAERLRQRLGRDLFYAFNTTGGAIDGYVGAIDRAISRTQDFIADLIHGKGAAKEMADAVRMQERSILAGRAMETMRAQNSTLALDMLRVEEKLAGAGRGDMSENVLRTRRELAEIEQKREQRLRGLNALEGISANQKAEIAASIDRIAQAEARLARVEANRRAGEFARNLEKERRGTFEERQRFDLEERSLRIGLMQMEGKSKEAQIERVRLDFARRRLELEQKGLDVAEKRRRLGVLNDIEQRTLAATRAGFRPDQTERRSAAVGVVGGRTLVAQQLGVQGTAQQATARSTQQIAQVVAGLPRWIQGIIRAVEGQPGAVYQ